MKKWKRVLSLGVVLGFLVVGSNAFADDKVRNSKLGDITAITLMGERWHNPNRGGFFFTTGNLPNDPYPLNYFIVRGESEKYVNRLLSTLLSAKSMNKRVTVGYQVINPNIVVVDENGNEFTLNEGDVTSITME